MQIIPNSGPEGTFGFFGSSSAYSSGADFMSAMDDALSAVNDGDYLNADSALADQSPQVDSPYSMHSTDGVTYTMSEVLFTKSELGELREQLIKEGAPVECLSQFDILADQANGATLAQIMASLMANPNAGKFSEDDAHAITALLGQLDPSGELAGNVLGQMRAGNGKGALSLIQDALGKLDFSDSIEIDIDGALALGRGLGLNADSLRLLGGSFGGASSLRLNAAQFDRLMDPAKNQFALDAANADKLEAALEKTLKPIIAKARDRMEKEKLASERESRRVQQSRILIDKTVQERSRAMMDQTVASTEDEIAGLKSQLTGHAGDDTNLRDAMMAGANNAKGAVNQPQQQEIGRFAKDAGNENPSDSKKGKSEGWQELLGKVEIKAAANIPQSPASSIVYSMLQGNSATEAILAQNPLMTQDPLLPRQVANQVEQGLLTAMRDGATRMDLQLHPAELGAIGITLIARNGEVTALLKSEKTETAEIMQRQLETIRANLEAQGVKVDKIEVQLENHQDAAQNNFQDLGQHNARQEEEARRQELARLRNLAAMKNLDAGQENSALAQSVQSMGQTARYAGQALHVVA